MCGQVGWVGLLVPHICRMRYGNNHLSLLPASISLGGCFMITGTDLPAVARRVERNTGIPAFGLKTNSMKSRQMPKCRQAHFLTIDN